LGKQEDTNAEPFETIAAGRIVAKCLFTHIMYIMKLYIRGPQKAVKLFGSIIKLYIWLEKGE
jgi:hypothetical protein